MSIYGNMNTISIFKEDNSFLDNESINYACESSEITLLSESIFKRHKPIPFELKITEEVINGSAAEYKKALEKLYKYFEENSSEYDQKFVDKQTYMQYYAILGCTFSNTCTKYNAKLSVYIPYLNKYCDDKNRSLIKKDMEKTIASLDKNENMNQKQKDWYKDITANVNKIK